MITFGTRANRRYSSYIPFMNKHGIVDIFFDKNSPFIGINLEHEFYNRIKNNSNIKYTIYKDIKQSPFSKFLNIKSFSAKHLDVVNQFDNINEEYKNRVHYLSNESIKICKIKTRDGKYLDSMLHIYSFGMMSHENDYIYIIIERQHIDHILSKKIVRTYGIQISSVYALEELIKITNHIDYKKININELEV